ncbi:MAG TPA: hypothetical protein VD862_02170 [Candidatus Paceibacterota bacterium]|nr:hypothetical protein [Candidatus Paceibacterota bacterium]
MESQNRLIVGLVIIVGLVGGYLYTSQLDPTAAVPPLPSNVDPQSLAPYKTLRIDFSVLNNPQYQQLRIIGQFPVPTTAPGKSNPFQ